MPSTAESSWHSEAGATGVPGQQQAETDQSRDQRFERRIGGREQRVLRRAVQQVDDGAVEVGAGGCGEQVVELAGLVHVDRDLDDGLAPGLAAEGLFLAEPACATPALPMATAPARMILVILLLNIT